MAVPAYNQNAVIEKPLMRNLAGGRSGRHRRDCEVELTGGERRQQRVIEAAADVKLDGRTLTDKPFGDAGKQQGAHARPGPDPDEPARRRAQLAHCLGREPQLRLERARMEEKRLAKGGEPDAAGVPLEESDAEPRLESVDAFGQR